MATRTCGFVWHLVWGLANGPGRGRGPEPEPEPEFRLKRKALQA